MFASAPGFFFSMDSSDLNSGPHACTSNTLPIELSGHRLTPSYFYLAIVEMTTVSSSFVSTAAQFPVV